MVEVLIAVSILGFVSPAFLIAIDTLYNAVNTPDEQIQAEALARSQLDEILAADYNDDPGCYPDSCYPVTVDVPSNYYLSISAQALDDREGGETCIDQDNCNTLQEVKVTVSRPSGNGESTPVLGVSVWKNKK